MVRILKTHYVAHEVDANGNAAYTSQDNQTWQKLIARQKPLVEKNACAEYLAGLDLLKLPTDHVPQCHEISNILKPLTGWELEPVPALISFDKFFHLLANRKFPAATFIRKPSDLDYLQEPDIFHEVFGHCPMLTNAACAEFTQKYGELGCIANEVEQAMLARLYWFTIEFGLIKTTRGLKAYGGGILSSKNETLYCISDASIKHVPFNLLEVMRTPYRIDIMQPIYFVIENFEILFHLIDQDLLAAARHAQRLGLFSPEFST